MLSNLLAMMPLLILIGGIWWYLRLRKSAAPALTAVHERKGRWFWWVAGIFSVLFVLASVGANKDGAGVVTHPAGAASKTYINYWLALALLIFLVWILKLRSRVKAGLAAKTQAENALSEAVQKTEAINTALAEKADEVAKLTQRLTEHGHLNVMDLEAQKKALNADLARLYQQLKTDQASATTERESAKAELRAIRMEIVETEAVALLQTVGVYQYRHPLSDAVAYQQRLNNIEESIKAFMKTEGAAVIGATGWTVNGSLVQGRKMISETSKLMLRAFNAEADNAVRNLKPYKLEAAVDRLRKVAATIAKLGKTMGICITDAYLKLRIQELELTADFLHKVAEEKEIERAERDRLREERKAQLELERERARLDKERQHYENALTALVLKGDDGGAERLREQLNDVQRAIAEVDYRTANIRAGYVYVISNIGAFGGDMVKIGMTRRLDPMDRVRELGDASVPFNFDVHALFFSKDAVGIETAMHQRLAAHRVNRVNLRREFFKVTPQDAKAHLAQLAGELLQFTDMPDAAEFRESMARASA